MEGKRHSRRGVKSKDRIKDISLTCRVLHVGQRLKEVDIWGILEFKNDMNSFQNLTSKLSTMNKPSSSGVPLPQTSVVGQIHKWRSNRIKSQLIPKWQTLLPKLIYIEESIRLWLEAVVLRKFSVRFEALGLLNELEASILLHEYRLDEIDHFLDECKDLAVVLKKKCNALSSMLQFSEVSCPFLILLCEIFLLVSVL
jgi:hypothetical protein